MNKIIEFDNSTVKVFSFNNDTEVKEYHIIISVTNPLLSYRKQLETIIETYSLMRNQLDGNPSAVFKRYFLSDASNQSDELMNYELESPDCALSVIQQAPLNGTKIALWAYMMTNVKTRALHSGLYEVEHGDYKHLWIGSANNKAKDSERQTRILLNDYVMQLINENCSLADNCIRTWFFVRDVDTQYGGLVKSRREFFVEQGLTPETHYIASTGIGGSPYDPKALVQLDSYAMTGFEPQQQRYLYGLSHLNRTIEYGVTFERATLMQYGDRNHVFISGTASINHKGEVMYVGNVQQQTFRMWENVETLLNEGGMSYEDVMQIIVYLRDGADYEMVKGLFDQKFPHIPTVFTLASVCRPTWLIEMECIAVKKANNDFRDF